MEIDFSKIENDDSFEQIINPREIFHVLPQKNEKYDYLRDVQTEVLNKWYENRNSKDVVLKMNTGGGKTLVALLILKSCLNEKKGPAVYIAPDNYLVNQVSKEARDLGIEFTTDSNSINFKQNKAILITNIQKLVNGKSIFGIGNEGIKQEITSLIIDDVHACIEKCEEQFTLSFNRTTKIYDSLFNLFRDDLNSQSENITFDIEQETPFTNILLPFWVWQNKINEVYRLISTEVDDNDTIKLFKWPLIKNYLTLCDCVIASHCIEISTRILPIEIINSYQSCERRIFMSATLPDDSKLISHLNINNEAIQKIITPNLANDIGDRLIIAPQEYNPDITETDIKKFVKKLSKNHNVIILVPSTARTYFWQEEADKILDKNNIDEGVEELKNGHVGLVVINNKYDGIDLPKNACKILVIDGLPDVRREIDKIDQNILQNNQYIIVKNIQKIEQGMGKGVRSNEDSCVIFLMGSSLTNYLYAKGAQNAFTQTTKAQIDLTNKVVKQSDSRSITQLEEIINLLINRNPQWLSAAKNCILYSKYTVGNINIITMPLKEAFYSAKVKDFNQSIQILQAACNTNTSIENCLLHYYLAVYTNFIEPVEAQLILKLANKLNSRLPHPIDGINYIRLESKKKNQALLCSDFLIQYQNNPNILLIEINSLLNDLNFRPESANPFEEAIKDLSQFIGFKAHRPENEFKKGPDDLWALGDLNYFIIECKNGTTNPIINKHDCNQLNGSIQWFKNNYDQSCNGIPILIHIGEIFEHACSPNSDIRIMNEKELNDLKNNLKAFIVNIVINNYFSNIEKIAQLLIHYKFTFENFINKYTKKFKIKS